MIEKQNSASQREGVQIEARNLTQAKRKASKTQSFQDTFLEILDSDGNTVAVKEKGGNWIDQSYFA
jgi:ribosomal protein S11